MELLCQGLPLTPTTPPDQQRGLQTGCCPLQSMTNYLQVMGLTVVAELAVAAADTAAVAAGMAADVAIAENGTCACSAVSVAHAGRGYWVACHPLHMVCQSGREVGGAA